jgi:hypothetical protein
MTMPHLNHTLTALTRNGSRVLSDLPNFKGETIALCDTEDAARLFTASPRMFRVLEAFLRYHKKKVNFELEEGELDAILLEATLALKLATGQF